MILKNLLYEGNLTDITVENGKITAVAPAAGGAGEDCTGLSVIPGLVDMHAHGCVGKDTMDGEFEEMCAFLAKNGTTSWLPTTMTQSYEAIKRVTEGKTDVPGTRILGFHMEGPYINAKKKGAQNGKFIRNPDLAEFKSLPGMRVVTIAPELDGSMEFIKECGALVCIGHTDADYETAMLAAANGAVSITHTYNAQTPFRHRDNGVVGAALRLRNLYSEVICDCAHSTPEALNIFFTCKGADKAVMISDALMCKGFKPGDKFIFGGHEVEIWEDGCAHLTDIPEHSIAGSTMHTNEGLRNLVERAGIPFDTAINSCTINPASLLGLDDHIGRIMTGYDADIVVLNDDDSVKQTFCKGIPQF